MGHPLRVVKIHGAIRRIADLIRPHAETAAGAKADLDAGVARVWLWLGCPVLLCVLFWLLARGGWSGRFDPHVDNYVNIAGMVPHSDALGYFTDTLNLAFTGRWTFMASRRPIAAAMRQLFALAADYSYLRAVLIQAAAVAITLWICVYRLLLWRGIIAAIAFLLLNLVLIEPFIGTFMTEPMAIMWVLLSCVFFHRKHGTELQGIRVSRTGDAHVGHAGPHGCFILCPGIRIVDRLVFRIGHA